MPPAMRESRQDECHRDKADTTISKMPETIHLATSFHVDSSNQKNPFMIVEDVNGYEAIFGQFHVYVGVGREKIESPDSFVHAEQIEAPRGEAQEDWLGPLSPHISSTKKKQGNKKNSLSSTVPMARVLSLLRSSSDLSDITFTDETENNKTHFEKVRLSL